MYYFRFADLLTDADVLEMSAPFTADRRIIQPGALSISIPIPNASIGSAVMNIVPQKTICHVYRGDAILGSYIIWAKTISMDTSGKVTADVQGATLESYLYKRRLSQDLVYAGEEQLDIAADLIAEAQIGYSAYPTSADIGVTPFTCAASGQLRDRTYLRSDADYVGDIIEALANVDNGFEFMIHTSDSGGTRERRILFGYPTLAASASPIVLEHPGNITAFSVLYDGSAGATVFTARGKSSATETGEEDAPLESDPGYATEYLDNGWPIIDRVVDYQSVSLKSTLDQYALWWASRRGGSIIVPDFDVDPTSMFDSGFSAMSLGATATVVMDNPAFPTVNGVPTWGQTSRVIGFELSVDESGKDSMGLIIESAFDPTDMEA